MENYKRKAVELISNLVLEYKEEPAVIPYSPGKTELMRGEQRSLARSLPERHGISSSRITALLQALEAEQRANVHSIVITKDGEVIAEAARPGFSPSLPHLSHSMSKSVTGMLIMMLVDEKKLDTGAKALSFFPEISNIAPMADEITVEHLLTMSSGASFSEMGVVTESEWTRVFFESEISFRPGERFAYNSMNSYVLMHIADIVTREHFSKSAEDFLRERLFAPLEIDNAFWERSAEGILKGGWGLYLSAQSWAKLGIMMMNYGSYRGKRIISRASVIEAISTQSITSEDVGDFNYGYQLWVSRKGDDFLFNGMLGQNVWVCQKNGIVVALNSGNNELFQKSPALEIIRSHLGSATLESKAVSRRDIRALGEKSASFFSTRQWIVPPPTLRGISYFLGLRSKAPFNEAFSSLIGSYAFPKNNQGILPIFVRVMQNNYQGGIKSFTFSRNGDLLHLTSREGDEKIEIDIGFYSYVCNTVRFGKEVYSVCAIADTVENTNGEIVYKIELIFPELPNTRRITLSLGAGAALNVKMREIPDDRITDAFIEALPSMSGKLGVMIGLIERNLGKNFIKSKLTELFAPEFSAVREGSADADSILAEENAKISAKINSSKLVRALIFRFIVEDDGDDKRPRSNMLTGILGKILPGQKKNENS